jgi:RNA polymerase sigma factor (sigma-70 family)
MRQWNDAELLSAYANQQSEEAFGVLVERHVELVYCAALRQVQNPHLAEEVTQATFTILAQKARQLSARATLSGWLCWTAHFVARNALKAEIRRHYREQEALMEPLINESKPEIWQQFAPLLDQAVAQLSDADRNAVVLRFYERKPLNEVGKILRIAPDTAQKRVSRALDKLRKFFAKRGVDSTTATIAENLSTYSVHATPVALAKTVTAMALAKGTAASIPTLTLAKGSLKLMAWGKAKAAFGVGAAIALTGTISTVTMANLIWSNKSARYQIEGDLTYHVTGNATNNDPVRHFTLTVDGPNWAVHLSDPKLGANGIQYQEEVQLNGAIYWYSFYGKPSPGGPVNSGGAVIESGDFPVEDGTFANYIWLGMASSAYFANATNGDIMSLFNRPRDARTFKVRGDWQLSGQPPYLPTSIDFHEYPSFYPPPFDKGFKEGQMRVLEQTNVGTHVFPKTFTCELFRPWRDSAVTSNDLNLAVTITVTADAIRLHSIPRILPPKTDGITYVGECRLTGGSRTNQITYNSTADRLPERPEINAIKAGHPELARLVATVSGRWSESPSHSFNKWIWGGIVLVVAATAMVAGLHLRRRKSRKAKCDG